MVVVTVVTIVASHATLFVTLLLSALVTVAQTDCAAASDWSLKVGRAAAQRPTPPRALGSPRMAASATSQRPLKGILKKKSSTASSVEDPTQESGGATQEVQRKKSQKWDESNILATHRPAYRDYDLVKVNETNTPCITVQDDGEDSVSDVDTTVDILTKKLMTVDTSESNCEGEEQESLKAHSSQSLLDKVERQRLFEMKRKLHHNEGMNIKYARQLISQDLQSEEEEEDDYNETCLQDMNEEKTAMEDSDEAPTGDEQQTQSCDA
ncbi:protein phosphatase inhibitor 2 family member C [Tupaia chinensis]|uniref:Putative type-1 protein phosphatase inhibitor 4 n=1 Tax=Tupaia chinensis TaxID=246437 RepID=L9KSP3_TUPCH|nr:protein phosphatase inhibitor 2 family member C [Tupaia chinensis]ELW65821.1 Putative type-1 protein phosphatase inhibitor 4 [Tupaia chinensis]